MRGEFSFLHVDIWFDMTKFIFKFRLGSLVVFLPIFVMIQK